MRIFYLIRILPMLWPCFLWAQHEPEDTTRGGWSFSASLYYYIVPEDRNQLSPILVASHDKLHLEARYNYEEYQTASIFAGRRFEIDDEVKLGITPMAGAVFGNLNGLAPGLELDAAYRKFDFYAETEYVFDLSNQSNSFFYSWGELAISATQAIRAGASYQKTRLYQTGRSVQWGPFAEIGFWKLTAGVYYFNPFTSSNLLIFSLSADF